VQWSSVNSPPRTICVPIGYTFLVMGRTVDFPLIFERSVPGRRGVRPPVCDVPTQPLAELLGEHLRPEPPALPEVSELDALRHYTRLSQRNYGIDVGFYPLGSCTMKYNPRINEKVAALSGFTHAHPLQPESLSQGALQLMYELQQDLKAITGFAEVTLQNVAGAHGELLSLMLIKAYHESRGEGDKRKIVLVPDSAHGTNPASAALCGFTVKSIPTNAEGDTDLDALQAALSDEVAAMMLTNPSTLGLFDRNARRACELLHEAGALVFCDGANMNALVGVVRPADIGFDCMHLNLHKTFSTPHGGGGPGAGAVGVSERLVPFLPVPRIVQTDDGRYALSYDHPQSIGRVHAFYGNFLNLVRAYAYIRAYGGRDLRTIGEFAVLNANYMLARIRHAFPPAVDRLCMHECVVTAKHYKQQYGVRAFDIAKRLLDYGFHPPTMYFPLIVPECLMIEPTESESKQTLDMFANALLEIAREAMEQPELLQNAPYNTPVRRLDEAGAAKSADFAMAGHGDLPAGGSRLRLLNDGVCPPEATMAGDVALLEAFQRGEIPPTLRVYQWASPALTYGVNQQLPPRLVDACNALGIPMLRRPTGGKAVLHGHDLTVGLVFRAADCRPAPPAFRFPLLAVGEESGESALAPRAAPLQRSGRGEPSLPSPPAPLPRRRERGAAHHAFWSAAASAAASGRKLRLPARSKLPLAPRAGEGDTGGEGVTQSRPYPRQVYECLAPALIEAFAQVGVPAVQGDAPAPDPRSADDGGDCFATPAIADLVHAETGVKLMGCALLVRGACVLMQASIPLRPPTVPVERLFGHPHPAPPPLDADALTDALYRTLTRVIHTPANAINTAP
jgi:glycine dehydrogenase subunit 2